MFNLPSIKLVGSNLASAAGLTSNVTSLVVFSISNFVILVLTDSLPLLIIRI